MRTAYKAARVFNGTELLSLPGGTAVLVADGRIEAVVPAPKPGPGCVMAELGDVTILPGLIDAHVHLAWDGSADPIERVGREPYALTVLRAANHAAAHLRAGVTVVRDLGSTRELGIHVARAIAEGIVTGPRVLAADLAVAVHASPAEYCMGLEPESASRAVRRRGASTFSGTDAGVAGRRHGALADELAAVVREGATPWQALRAATVEAAALLGISSDYGVLKPGRRADLLVVGGDPLCDIEALRDVRMVVSGGRVVVDSGSSNAAQASTRPAQGIREFVRDHRAIIRALTSRVEHPEFSPDQQRILLEVGPRAGTDMTELRAALDIDAGQLSRAVHDLQAHGALKIQRSAADRRRRTVVVTEAGRRAYEQLDSAQDKAIGELINRLSTVEQARLASAMDALQWLFRITTRRRPPSSAVISDQSCGAERL